MVRRPFAQLAFEEVPDAPRVPHGFFAAPSRTLQVASKPFGPIDIDVRVHGSGPPLLLVHGFMTSSYSWRYAMAPLGEHFTVYMPDLPGAGRSGKPDVSYAPDALADFIGELMSALGLRGAPVIGNSMGGYLCMRLALRDPGAMSRLVNLHSPGLPTARIYALRAALSLMPGWRRLLRAMVQRGPERWVHKNVHYFDETLKSREEHREYAAPLSTPLGLNAFARMLEETMDVRHMRRFERTLRARPAFPIPLQLLYAERDPMVPPSVGQRLRTLLPAAEFIQLRAASHFAHVDATAAFVDAVLPFLRKG